MEPINFCGKSHDEICSYGSKVRDRIFFQIHKLEKNLKPTKSRPLKPVGLGVIEIKVRVESEEFRVLYVIREGAIFVLLAYHKKTKRTPKRHISAATKTLKKLNQIIAKKNTKSTK